MLPDEVDEPDDFMNPSNLSARFRYLASLRKFHKCNAKGKQRVVTVVVYEDDKQTRGVENGTCGGSRNRQRRHS